MKWTGIEAIHDYWKLRPWRSAAKLEVYIAECKASRLRAQEEERLRELPHRIHRIMRYPIAKFTRKKFDALPKLKELKLYECPMGTWLSWPDFEPALPDVRVVGQVVPGLEAIAEQWGAGMSIPERYVNKYRVEFIAEPALAEQVTAPAA